MGLLVQSDLSAAQRGNLSAEYGGLSAWCGLSMVFPSQALITVEIGEILNEYFESVFTVERDVEGKERQEINSDILKNIHITEEEVLD
eukprot:g41161.t1